MFFIFNVGQEEIIRVERVSQCLVSLITNIFTILDAYVMILVYVYYKIYYLLYYNTIRKNILLRNFKQTCSLQILTTYDYLLIIYFVIYCLCWKNKCDNLKMLMLILLNRNYCLLVSFYLPKMIRIDFLYIVLQ